jgi:hypothetical protein
MKAPIVFTVVFLLGVPPSALAQAPPAAPPPPDPKALRSLKVRFEREPTVEEVQMAALTFFRVNPSRVDGYRRGAAWKALAPDIEVSMTRDSSSADRRLIDVLYTSNPRFKDGKDFEYTNNAGYSVFVRAHWGLDRLIFNAEVLDVTSLVGVQESLLREITSLYYTRRRLLTMFTLNPPQSKGEALTERIRLDEITSNLNALTGGYFAKELRKRDIR